MSTAIGVLNPPAVHPSTRTQRSRTFDEILSDAGAPPLPEWHVEHYKRSMLLQSYQNRGLGRVAQRYGTAIIKVNAGALMFVSATLALMMMNLVSAFATGYWIGQAYWLI